MSRHVDMGEKFTGARKDEHIRIHGPTDERDRKGATAEPPAPRERLDTLWPKPDFRAIATAGERSAQTCLAWLCLYGQIGQYPPTLDLVDMRTGEWPKFWRAGIAFLRAAWERGEDDFERLQADYTRAMLAVAGPRRDPSLPPYGAGIQRARQIHPVLPLSGAARHRMTNHIALGWPHETRLHDSDAFGACLLTNSRPQRWALISFKPNGGMEWLEQPMIEHASEAEALLKLPEAVASLLSRRDGKKESRERRPIRQRATRPTLDMPPTRTGPAIAHRHGPADTALLMTTFGLRGIEFGNWVPNAERGDLLDLTFEAMADLCRILRAPLAAASLWGRIGIAYGSRGVGVDHAAATYNHSLGLVHLTRTSGCGTLAHERGHAIDAALVDIVQPYHHKGPGILRIGSGNLIWEQGDQTSSSVSEAARTLHLATNDRALPGLHKASLRMDNHKRWKYWTKPEEIFARIFETWASDTLLAAGQHNQFLVHGVGAPGEPTRWKHAEHDPYPQGDERRRAVAAMDRFIADTLALLVRSAPARPAPDDISGTPRADRPTPAPPQPEIRRPDITESPYRHPLLRNTSANTTPSHASNTPAQQPQTPKPGSEAPRPGSALLQRLRAMKA